jgi:multidrug efflux pump subunit AcrB
VSEIRHIKYKYPLLALGILMLAGGFFSYNNLKTGLFPDITFPKIKVIADAGQQPVDKMMALVTVPLENIIRRAEGIDYIRSTTSRGSCEISVFLKWKSDIDKSKQQIESLMNTIKDELPVGTSLSVEKMNPSILPVMGYSLEGNRTPVELRKIAQYQIKPFLAAVPGVSDIVVVGGKTKEYQVILNTYRLTTMGITPQMVQNAVQQANLLESNGYISDFNRMYLTLTDNAIDELNDLKELVIVNSSNRLVKLKNVADIEINEVKE